VGAEELLAADTGRDGGAEHEDERHAHVQRDLGPQHGRPSRYGPERTRARGHDDEEDARGDG
jgi:hypothetical protein